MKHVSTITLRQDPDEPRLVIKLYRENLTAFYFQLESTTTPIPSKLLKIHTATTFAEAKREAEKLLRLQRGICRFILGKSPDLPEDMKAMEAEIPAYLHFLNTDTTVGKMAEDLRLEWLAGSTN